VTAHAEEVRVEPSSDPGRDEYGLPPVDIEIPDDARDLDRDVQAYYREVRARRRQLRLRRLTTPLIRHGMVIPLVAGCLALTLLSGTLLTVLAGRQTPTRVSSGATHRPTPTTAPGLPNAQVELDGKQVGLRSLAPAVLAWVPSACACATALRQLAQQARAANVYFYIVGTDQPMSGLTTLAAQAGQPGTRVINDTTDALSTYQPVGLTAILAAGDGSVGGVVRRFPSGTGDQQVATGLKTLTGTGQGSPSAIPTPTT
jgi:hypothetical protein